MQPEQDPTWLEKFKAYVLAHGGLGGEDIRQQQTGENVDVSTGTAKGYADGGEVDEQNPSTDQVPEFVKNWVMAKSDSTGSQPPALEDYNQEANKIIGTPEDRTKLLQKVQNPGIGGSIGTALAGLGDALTNSRGGNQHALANVQSLIQNRGNQTLENFDKTSAMGKEKYALGQELEAKNPNSPLSRQAQAAYGPLLSKVIPGVDPSKMSAKFISDVTGKGVDEIKAESEAKMAGATLGLKETEAQIAGAREAQERKHQTAEEDARNKQLAQESDKAKTDAALKQEELQKSAAEPLAKQSYLNPLNWGHTGDISKARQTLADISQGKMAPNPQAPQPVTPEDQKAIQWAQSNPNDPRAKKILSLHGL